MNIYANLYDVVAENLEQANIEFGYKKSTFLCDTSSSPRLVDVSKYLEFDNRTFFQAVFVAGFKRLPEEKEVQRWYEHMKLPREVFQKEFLTHVANSSVVAINHIELINNPYFSHKRGLKYKVMGTLYGLTDKSALREFGKKLPAPIQRIIRKVFL